MTQTADSLLFKQKRILALKKMSFFCKTIIIFHKKNLKEQFLMNSYVKKDFNFIHQNKNIDKKKLNTYSYLHKKKHLLM